MNLARFLAIAMAGACVLPPGTSSAVSLVVNSANDANDGSCNSGHCSLREAITVANSTPQVPDSISFSFTIPVRGDILFTPASALPTIVGPLTINGYTQSGTDANDSTTFSNADLRIRINGSSGTAPPIGLAVCSNNVILRGLSFTNWAGTAVSFGTDNAGSNCASAITGAAFHGNFVGLTGSGSGIAGNGNGLLVRNTTIAIGSTNIADRNVFANNDAALDISSSTAASTVLGNVFGTSRNGASAMGNDLAIGLSASNVVIGSTSAPNHIRHGRGGLRVFSGIDNDFYANRVFDTEFPAITFSSTGNQVTPNDTNDADGGANGQQNFPEISDVTRIAGGLHITGSIDAPVTFNPVPYRIGVYASIGCHASGNGGGELFIGSADVAIRGNTNETFAFDLVSATTVPIGYVLTLTATGPDGTSEFSECRNIDAVSGFAVNTTTDTVDAQGCDATHCSLREALTAANTRIGPDSIRFDIPVASTSELLITLASPLPDITDTLNIDGYTQPGSAPNTDPEFSNAIVRVRVHGEAFTPERLFGVCAPDTTIRGLAMTGANPSGIAMSLVDHCAVGVKDRLRLLGNFFGLRADGSTAETNQQSVTVDGADSLVGSEDPADRNVFAGGFGGIKFNAVATNSAALGNLFGTDRTGQLDRGINRAVEFTGGLNAPPLNLQIGSATAPNFFRFNGVGINAGANLNPGPAFFTHNLYRQHDTLAINLGNTPVVTANDVDDNDDGGNRGQNFPVLSAAFEAPTGVQVTGTLDVRASIVNVPFQLSFYANTSCQALGNGGGERLLGVVTHNFTQTTGEAFDFTLDTDAPVLVGEFITALATGPDGTSEFSACRVVADAIEVFEVNQASDSSDGNCDSHCTLREAIERAELTAGPQFIAFNIAGDGPHTIALTNPLPVIADIVTINGYSEPDAVENTAAIGSDAVIKIVLDANGQANILRTCADASVEIRGLALVNAQAAAIDAIPDQINCGSSSPLVLRGNYFGIRPDGTADGNGNAVNARQQKVVIGSGAFADRNLFGNSSGHAVRLEGFLANASAINNNLFGIGPDGISDHGNGGTALELTNVSGVDVGGSGFEANAFRFNARGIVIKTLSAPGANNNAVFGNEFSANSGLAIDLSEDGSDTDGVTPNDTDDLDSGPNGLQNTPVLASAAVNGDTVTVTGTLDVGNPVTQGMRISIYLSDTCVGGAHNEAQQLLASELRNFSTSSEGFVFAINLPFAAEPRFISATVNGPTGTSELSNCVAAIQPVDLFKNDFE